MAVAGGRVGEDVVVADDDVQAAVARQGYLGMRADPVSTVTRTRTPLARLLDDARRQTVAVLQSRSARRTPLGARPREAAHERAIPVTPSTS